MNKIGVESFDYVFLKNDYFTGARGTRLRNDIVSIKYVDGTQIYRMYLNNTEEYVDLPVDKLMVNELSKITWTKDASTRNVGNFVKSDADDINLNAILQRYDKKYGYYVEHLVKEKDIISQKDKKEKRKEFIHNNPKANTEETD